ncbi:MAG: Death on curing protein [Parcubacteria group bacterium GW2011_GWA2_50_10b]|nr:MAG: Death on curing protein [Parcubacteria group bacterium GW2011_GWA2_50_10b]
MTIDETSGSHGVRDNHAIFSLENSPKQKVFSQELYPTAFLKAAVYIREILMNHPFVDGNKRTGMTCAFVFLENNGFVSTAHEGEIEKFALRVIGDKLDPRAIASWLQKHVKKI